MKGEHKILFVQGRGYVKAGQHLSYQFTNKPHEAQAFPIREVWHQEKELNQVKSDLEAHGLEHEEEIYSWETRKL
jgi:hypothetical protein